jgi:hypothetical protein
MVFVVEAIATGISRFHGGIVGSMMGGKSEG